MCRQQQSCPSEIHDVHFNSLVCLWIASKVAGIYCMLNYVLLARSAADILTEIMNRLYEVPVVLSVFALESPWYYLFALKLRDGRSSSNDVTDL